MVRHSTPARILSKLVLLVTLAAGMAGCAVYAAPPPRGGYYYAPPPVVVYHPYGRGYW